MDALGSCHGLFSEVVSTVLGIDGCVFPSMIARERDSLWASGGALAVGLFGRAGAAEEAAEGLGHVPVVDGGG